MKFLLAYTWTDPFNLNTKFGNTINVVSCKDKKDSFVQLVEVLKELKVNKRNSNIILSRVIQTIKLYLDYNDFNKVIMGIETWISEYTESDGYEFNYIIKESQ